MKKKLRHAVLLQVKSPDLRTNLGDDWYMLMDICTFDFVKTEKCIKWIYKKKIHVILHTDTVVKSISYLKRREKKGKSWFPKKTDMIFCSLLEETFYVLRVIGVFLFLFDIVKLDISQEQKTKFLQAIGLFEVFVSQTDQKKKNPNIPFHF